MTEVFYAGRHSNATRESKGRALSCCFLSCNHFESIFGYLDNILGHFRSQLDTYYLFIST